jgi:hypothetical protein
LKQLSKAIIDKYKASTSSGSLYASLTGGLWNSEAPDDTPYPYGVFYTIDRTPKHVQEGEFTHYKYEECVIQFSIYEDGNAVENIEDVYDKLTALYDETKLTLSSYVTVNFTREFDRLDKLGTESDKYWQYVIQYRGLFERST